MKFLENTGPVAVLFDKAKLRRDRNNSRDMGLDFILTLTPEVLKALPKALQESYTLLAKPNGAVACKIDVDVKHRTVRFFLAPDMPQVLAVHDVTLGSFWMEKLAKGSGHDITLSFSLDVPLDGTTGPWLVENFGNQIWLQVEPTQPELIATEE